MLIVLCPMFQVDVAKLRRKIRTAKRFGEYFQKEKKYGSSSILLNKTKTNNARPQVAKEGTQ